MVILNRQQSNRCLSQSMLPYGVVLLVTVMGLLVASMTAAGLRANEIPANEIPSQENQAKRELNPSLTPLSDSSNLPLVFNASANGGFEGQGRPASRSSGGSRGNCQALLIALVPGEGTLSDDCSQPTQSAMAFTTTPMPTLWFYIPEQDSTLQAELALLNDNYQAIAIETLALPSTTGIVGIPLGYELEMNQSYRWNFSISPDTNPSRILIVEGFVRRIEPETELNQHLENASGGRDRIVRLAQFGIWHDALTELIMLRQQQPADITVMDDWQDFLGSVGLDVIADTPIQFQNP